MIRSYFIRILMIIWTFHGVKKGAKIRKVGCELWDIDPWSNFCDPHWELICRNKWQLATSGISISPEIAVGTHFYARHGTKTTPVLLPTDGKAFWLLLLSSVSLLSGNRVHLLLYPKGDGSGRWNPKKDKPQH